MDSFQQHRWEFWKCLKDAMSARLDEISALWAGLSTLVSAIKKIMNCPWDKVLTVLMYHHAGFPLATLLHSDKKYFELCGDATVTVCHRYTPSDQLVTMMKHADIIISATGEWQAGKGEMVV